MIQSHLYLHKDIAIITHTARQMLDGQTYGHDIFEPNPPLIFYLHFLPILIANKTGFNLVSLLRLEFITMIFSSALLVRGLLKKVFRHESDVDNTDNRLVDIMACGVTIAFLFLPADAFGQREHLFLILTTPYIFLAVCRLNNQLIAPTMAIAIGIIAGIGFAIKPFFLATFLCIELLFVCRKKNRWGWVRPESIASIALIIVYGLAVIWFYPGYFNMVLPLWIPYYQGIAQSWGQLLTQSIFLWCCSAVFLACWVKNEDPHANMKHILACGILGTLISFLIPRVNWYYHILPALSFSFLYFILIIAELMASNGRVISRAQISGITILILVIFLFPIIQSGSRTLDSIAYFEADNPEKKLMKFLHTQANHPRFLFFSMTHDLYHLEFYSTAYPVCSFSSCMWEYMRLGSLSKSHQQAILSFVMKILTHDINDKKPQFIIVDTQSALIYLKKTINYPVEYSQDQSFREAWSHYHYVTHIKPYDIYKRT